MLWALGMILLGLTSTTSPEVPADPDVRRIQPWQIILYWLGPLSPPIHFTILLLWGAMNPPLPAYVLAGCTVLLLYMALRIGLVSSVSKHIGQEREELARVKEQGRLLYELHDTAKQEVHGISLTLRAAIDTERSGGRKETLEMFGRALAASREAEFRISRPYDELSALRGESPPGAADFLRQRLQKFEEYFGGEGLLRHPGLPRSIEPGRDCCPSQGVRGGVLERRQALRREQHIPGVSSGRLSAHHPCSGRRPRLRHWKTATRSRPGVHAPACRRGWRGSGCDLHPWTGYFGAGKVPQAPEHRQPVAGRSGRLHEGKQNVAAKLFFVVAFEVAVGDGHAPVTAERPARDLYARRGLAAFVLGPVHELHDVTHIILLEA